jgi:hypothetical protein
MEGQADMRVESMLLARRKLGKCILLEEKEQGHMLQLQGDKQRVLTSKVGAL